MHLLSELSAFYRFFWKTPKSDKTIVFYSEHQGYYVYFEGLIEDLIRNHDHPFCYVTSDPNDPLLSRHHPKIRVFHLSGLLPFFMALANCRVCVMTLPDLGQYHIRRSIHGVHYVYAFHSLHSVHMFYRPGAFDHYDSILCVGPHQIEEIRKEEALYDRKPKILVEAGYYRLERVYRAFQKYQEKSSEPSSRRSVILVAPSWGASNILEAYGETLVDSLLDAGYEVIMRPHPETMRRFPRLAESFEERFGSDPRVTLERSVSTDDSLLRADVLVTDWSAIALEYAFGTERPVLYLDTPVKQHNPKWAELGIQPIEMKLRSQIGMVASIEEIPNIAKTIDQLIRDRPTFKSRILELRREYVFAFGRSSEIGARHIVEMAGQHADAA
jgi:YidC/Oxa1 family membrane protein insertase